MNYKLRCRRRYIIVFLIMFYNASFAIFPGDSLVHPSAIAATDSSKDDDERSYIYGIDYGSNTSFKGVNQSASQHYFSPNFTYTAKSGFFIYSAAYYLLDQNHFIDELDLAAGWDFNISKKTKGSISYMKSFFNEESPQVNSTLTHNIQFYVKRKIFWNIKSKLAFDFYFGGDMDYTLTWGNSRAYSWYELFREDDDLTITPKIRIIAGTQNFFVTKTSSVNTSNKVKKGAKAAFSSITSTTITNQIKKVEFGVISYIITIPVAYTVGKFTFEPSFNYSIPGDLNARPSRAYVMVSFYCTM